ncbi:MAG: class I SAM-dependent methyltransferase [Proteobacteria bacterium]|nr:class I SAM-dependent methyltransferase [Pseudomonadota bacterium]
MSVSDPEDLVTQGFGWLQSHLLNHAELTLRTALAAKPGDVSALRLHGIALFKLGRRDEGIAEIARACEAPGASPRAWGDLAVALRDAGRIAEAEAAYARGVAAQPATASVPPLATQVFCTDLGHHDFKIVDYDYRAEIRYGGQRPAHPELRAQIETGRDRYAAFLDAAAALQPDFADVQLGGTYDQAEPFWLNSWFPPLDAIALTTMLKAHNPARMVEIGSGVSTKYARRAIQRYGLRTRITSVDPQPRNEVDKLCDEVLRRPLERCDIALFEALEPGDIFFLDSSHRSFQGSDVTVFFLEILPRLKPGVVVQVHDIYLPYDYISGHLNRLWNEQYLLASALIFAPGRFEILFPSWFVVQDPALSSQAETLFRKGAMSDLSLYGASFWMRVR